MVFHHKEAPQNSKQPQDGYTKGPFPFSVATTTENLEKEDDIINHKTKIKLRGGITILMTHR